MIPHKSDNRWELLVTGQKKCQCQVLPVSILLDRVIESTQRDNSPENIRQCIEETYNFFVRYAPILKKDIGKIFDFSSESIM